MRPIAVLMPPSAEPPSWHGHDESRAGLLADPPVAVGPRRVEVNRIAGVQDVVITGYAQRQPSPQDVQELDAGMVVRARLLRRDGLELRVVGVQAALDGGEVERLEE